MSIRTELGDFSSIVCFKAVITGVEDTLGDEAAGVVFTRGGKVRGESVATALGLAGKKPPMDQLGSALDSALGKNGTKLCAVRGAHMDGDKIVIETTETVCSAGEPAGSTRKCTFTLGAVWGALETAMGQRYDAKQTESVLTGGSCDKFVFTPIS